MLKYIIKCASLRYEIKFSEKLKVKHEEAKKIKVLLGGDTSERQVSLMSGTNVWLKLLNSLDYMPTPYFLATTHDIWELPYSFALNYTVEEILDCCNDAKKIFLRLKVLVPPILTRLGIPAFDINSLIEPRCMSLDQFCKEAAAGNSFVFIALHGGCGEDGRIQAKLNQYQLAYNGSDEKASKLCMDKYLTGKVISDLRDPQLISATKYLIPAKSTKSIDEIWNSAVRLLNTSDILIKLKIWNNPANAGIIPDTITDSHGFVIKDALYL
jgi:D-alanine-D-alanine ligase-like ATP-grasp enzyme